MGGTSLCVGRHQILKWWVGNPGIRVWSRRENGLRIDRRSELEIGVLLMRGPLGRI